MFRVKVKKELLITNQSKVCYYLNGRLHRLDGPAVEFKDGNCSYFVDGISCSKFQWEVYRKLPLYEKFRNRMKNV